jgi:hypothetical protein
LGQPILQRPGQRSDVAASAKRGLVGGGVRIRVARRRRLLGVATRSRGSGERRHQEGHCQNAEAGKRLSVKRIGRPEELADAVLFLIKNGYVNGITLTVDGGGLLAPGRSPTLAGRDFRVAPTHGGGALVSGTDHHHRLLVSGDHVHHGLLGENR